MSKNFLDKDGVPVLWEEIEKNFISTEDLIPIINAIDETKANINSPDFTGIPTAPTAKKTDRSNQIATTEFVQQVADDFIIKFWKRSSSYCYYYSSDCSNSTSNK